MTNYVTTADIAREEGIKQRTIQKRIKRLKIQVQRAGSAFLLTANQAQQVRKDKRKPGRKAKKSTNGNGK